MREGRLYDLGHVLDEDIPVFPGRFFKQTLVTTAHHQNAARWWGANEVNWITEQVSATMQLGTHLDALCHLQIGDRGYNGWTSPSSPAPPASSGSASRPCRRSSPAGCWLDVSGFGRRPAT